MNKILSLLHTDPFSFALLLLLVGVVIAAAVVAAIASVYALRDHLAEGPNRSDGAMRRRRIHRL